MADRAAQQTQAIRDWARTQGLDEPAAILLAFVAAPPKVRGELDSLVLDPVVYRIRAYGRERMHTSVPKTEDDFVVDWDYDPHDPNYDMFKNEDIHAAAVDH
ncbi:hypothetical protein [Williamsia soli]|uniref:hypothetical protein n=1 Tax=Williamsia soli TaxID=364929 RepID=UPI001A9EFA59|nr:hypothetical protein [Williamsia soli]